MAAKKESAAGSAKINPLAKNLTKDAKKEQALAAAMDQIERAFGKGAIMRLGQSSNMDIEAIPTGSLSLDIALGIGGLPMGRIVEIYGPESSGKTTLTLELIAQAQKLGKVCAFIDAEHALDPTYAKRLGVRIEDVLISQPDTGEQALDICESLVRSGGVDVVIIDSVAALVPKAEIEGDMGDSHVGLQARLMSQALRKLTGIIKQANCMVVFINQLRMKIGVMFGNPETTTGGNALKYYASVRLDIRKGQQIKEGDKKNVKVLGNQTSVKVVKNKVAPPFRTAHFDILFNYGIAKNGELIDLGETAGVVKKTGAWFSYNGQKIGQGKTNAMRYLDEHPEEADAIEKAIREYFKANSSYADTTEIGSAEEPEAPEAESGDPLKDSLDSIRDEDLITEFPEDL
ncbi:MAG: recombinase RecA [Succinivibrio sp.]|jgi:recombination protein RecA|nr:recombinase RecA [Succinivibrio sp.]